MSFLRKNRQSLVQANEIPVYIQRPHFSLEDMKKFFHEVETTFNFPKPNNLLLSDDAWAAIKLRVDPLARNILDPHRYTMAASGVAFLIIIVFYAIRPGYDRKRIHQTLNDDEIVDSDDEIFDDYIHDDEYERIHSMDDVVAAELAYFNSALGRQMWIWQVGLISSLSILFSCVLLIAVLMERRNVAIDSQITTAIEEIKDRVREEGIDVEYRKKSSRQGLLFCCFLFGKYIRPTRVVVFTKLDSPSPPTSSKKANFFSDDYQRKYFPPSRLRSDADSVHGSTSGVSSVGPFSLSIA
mmetsp:Transcript_34330/g.70273  ORF Transcript_34330/g.70273 Transcript_34330/m.70273 type:complete len:297 (+) Transcript_34330:296-1186(+)